MFFLKGISHFTSTFVWKLVLVYRCPPGSIPENFGLYYCLHLCSLVVTCFKNYILCPLCIISNFKIKYFHCSICYSGLDLHLYCCGLLCHMSLTHLTARFILPPSSGSYYVWWLFFNFVLFLFFQFLCIFSTGTSQSKVSTDILFGLRQGVFNLYYEVTK